MSLEIGASMLVVMVNVSFSAMLVSEVTNVIVGLFVFSTVKVTCCSPFSVALVTDSISIIMVSSYSTNSSATTLIVAVLLKAPEGMVIVVAVMV